MEKIELLAPAGDFECLKSAVQNGADAVYFGSNRFNARANSKNFNDDELVEAIEYAKLRGVKTHLTLNILIQNNEFEDALELVKKAYIAGIDAVIVQDLGLAKKIIENFPNLEVHASTQMTTYNEDGVHELEMLGVKRVVLARELSIPEIKKICDNASVDIEIFAHGALCICYSGQCLMSSMIGGRSGNRGTCAGSCRLPYALLKDGNVTDKGYLLSSKDVCTLDILPEILKTGVKSLKLEGRMKSPIYVGLVTSIYRKYIDLALSNKPYIVEKEDREKLTQIFNRGGFSTGYLNGKLGRDMMYFKRPNHIGIKIGEVISYNRNKGYVKVKLEDILELGDSIAIGEATCKISELMQGNNNIKLMKKDQIATIGRIYGEINPKTFVYRTVKFSLNKEVENYNLKENVKRKITAKVKIIKNEKVELEVIDNETKFLEKVVGEAIPEIALKTPTSRERIIEQLNKTGNTIFEIENIDLNMDNDIVVPISSINEIRRNALENLQNKITKSFTRKYDSNIELENLQNKINNGKIETTICINRFNNNIDYTSLKGIDNFYIPIEAFLNKEYANNIKKICNKFNAYAVLPAITKEHFLTLIKNKINEINVKGFVLSNISQLEFVNKGEKIANYNFNAFNDYTINELKKLGFTKFVISPELNKENIKGLNSNLNKELIVYGRTLLMTSEYCTIGKFNGCTGKCEDGKYELKDRLGLKFPVYTNRINCNNMIYNSKITSIEWKDLNVNSIRIDLLDETEEEIQTIIDTHKSSKKLEGKEYTNGNLNKNI